MQLELVYSSTNWSTSDVTRGQGSCPRAQQAKNTKQHQQHILWITNTKVCVISQRTFASLISSLLGIGYSIALHSILLSGLVAPPPKKKCGCTGAESPSYATVIDTTAPQSVLLCPFSCYRHLKLSSFTSCKSLAFATTAADVTITSFHWIAQINLVLLTCNQKSWWHFLANSLTEIWSLQTWDLWKKTGAVEHGFTFPHGILGRCYFLNCFRF